MLLERSSNEHCFFIRIIGVQEAEYKRMPHIQICICLKLSGAWRSLARFGHDIASAPGSSAVSSSQTWSKSGAEEYLRPVSLLLVLLAVLDLPSPQLFAVRTLCTLDYLLTGCWNRIVTHHLD